MSDRTAPPIGQVSFEIHASPCDSPVMLRRLGSEPADGFEEYVEAIKKRVARGDKWAWCEIVAIARFGEYSGKSRVLREVSVSSAEDFVVTHPKYEELCSEAYQQLVANMAVDETTFATLPRDAASNSAPPH